MTEAIEVRNKFAGMLDTPRVKEQIARALPSHLSIDRFMRICLVTIGSRSDLQQCSPISIMSAVVEASQLGLELDPVLGHGYILAFANKDTPGVKKATFIPGYKGFVHLMRNSGLVANVNAELVRKEDEFGIKLGTDRGLLHVPKLDAKGRADERNWLGAYSTVNFLTGYVDFQYLTAEEINDHRKRSPAERAGVSGPWKTDTEPMWLKTTIRVIARRMPLSPTTQKIVKAATLDEYRENEEYLAREPEAPALQPSGDNDVAIDVSSSFSTSNEEAKSEDQPAPPKEKVRRKSEKAAAAKTSDAGIPKANIPKGNIPKEPPPEFLGSGQIKSIEKLAYEEKNMTRPELFKILGNMGYEKLDEVPKTSFSKLWQEVSSEKRRG